MREQEFKSKLISLLPLDEVPVHVHRFAARAPCDSKGSEWAAKEKPTPISQFFLAPAAPGTPTRRHALGRLPTPPPLPENLLLRLHRKLPSAPPASTTCKPHSSRGRGRPELGPSRLSDMGWAGILG